MSQVEDNALMIVALFTLVFPLLFVSSAYVLPLINMLDLDTAPTVNDTVTRSVDEDWNNGTIDNLQTDGSIIYPAASETGSWRSQLFNIEGNRILTVEYGADMRDGNGTLTVNAWTDEVDSNPDKTQTVDLRSGDISEQLNFSQYNHFDVEIELTETDGSSNQRPNVDYINLEFEIVNDDEIGLSQSQARPLLYMVYVFSLLLMLFTMYYAISFVVQND